MRELAPGFCSETRSRAARRGASRAKKGRQAGALHALREGEARLFVETFARHLCQYLTSMKPTLFILLASSVALYAETEEQLSKQFTVLPSGKLVVEVDFGTIEVNTNGDNQVTVEVVRSVSRSNKADEEAFLRDNPITFSQDGNTVRVSSHAKRSMVWSHGFQRNQAHYTITVPAPFNAQLNTAGGGINVNDLSGGVKAQTSGGGLRFARLHGNLTGGTSGGSIRVADCEGPLKISTSGGGIDVFGGSGSLEGSTSGGSVNVRDFHGPAHVSTSGGGIEIEDVTGEIHGSTSGGSIAARFSTPLAEQVKLETSGGSVTLRVPDSSAFDLDAATSGGSVHSEIPVAIVGKPEHSRLRGPVNSGGKPVVLRTTGGSIQVKKT